jgi:hypothetical protein
MPWSLITSGVIAEACVVGMAAIFYFRIFSESRPEGRDPYPRYALRLHLKSRSPTVGLFCRFGGLAGSLFCGVAGVIRSFGGMFANRASGHVERRS